MRRFVPMLVIPALWLARTALAADGALDGSFGNYLPGVSKVAFDLGGGNADSVSEVLVQADGKLVLVGTVDTALGTQIAAARLNANGGVDSGFGTGGKFHSLPPGNYSSAAAVGAALQSDGKVVLAGPATLTGSSTSDFIVCRLTTGGAFDTGFGSSGCTRIAFDLGLNNDTARAVAIQADGKVVVAGDAAGAAAGYGSDFGVVRLLANGIPDPGFGFGGSGRQVVTRFDELAGVGVHTLDTVRTMVIQADGKIVVAGETAILPGGDYNMAVARLDGVGQIDAGYGNGGVQIITFNLGSSNNDSAHAAALQRDGALVLAGYASRSTAGDTDYALARLTTVGGLDSTFSGDGKAQVFFDLGGSLPDFAEAVVMQSDGKILAAGYSYNGAAGGVNDDDISVARLLSGGTLDTSFGAGGKATFGLNLGGANFDRATAIALQSGRIVLAGEVALASGNRDFIALRLDNDLIFTDDFDL